MEKRSPLKAKPLRTPGQSVQETIDKIIDDKFFNYFFFSTSFVALAAYEWFEYLQGKFIHPIFVTLVAIGLVVYSTVRIFFLRKHVKNLKLGRDGEKAVGQFLEVLREDGCIIFHDIMGDNFNIDHVVISERGIYCIETKTYSKPDKGSPAVHFDGDRLTIDTIGDKSEILIQVNAATNWLQRTILESTGRCLSVKPVILFPGWMVNSTHFDEIWVLEPKGFPKFLQNQNSIISPEDKKLAAYHLSRYIRSL